MQQFTLSIEQRDGVGSSKSNGLRRKGLLPGVLYAANENTIPVTVNRNEFVKLVKRATSSQLFTLKSDDSALNGKITIIKGIQKDYMNQSEPIHVDFMAIREDKELTLDVPLKVVGEPVGVKIHGGVLSVAVHEITISCLPKNIPDRLALDVSGVDLGESLHARDIPLPEGVQLAGDPDDTIVSVVEIRAVEEAASAEAAGAEGAEGTAAAAAPAEGGASADAAKAGGKEGK